ncbi:NAD(P)H-binding protein [Pseudonocardia ailaonensis]|uniref:NAD(P)H-binding protein n=1 Tax=Pseudonocardia ailaonensis TaxID=367279 RepID=A0ABN2N4K1_9PSEU
MTVLVTGATGVVGRAVVNALREAGREVRALSRDPGRAAVVLGPGTAIVKGDLGDRDSLRAAVRGVDGVFLVSAAEHKPAHDRNLGTAAAAAGVDHVVALSSFAASEGDGSVLGRWHLEGERVVAESGVGWTVLRPNGFMSNALGWAAGVRAGLVRAPLPDAVSVPIDPRDIAAAAVAAFAAPPAGEVHVLTGPERLTTMEQVGRIAAVIGREVRFEEVPLAEARAALARRYPAEVADAVLAARVSAGAERGVPTGTVRALTGRPPVTFTQWVRDHTEAFGGIVSAANA